MNTKLNLKTGFTGVKKNVYFLLVCWCNVDRSAGSDFVHLRHDVFSSLNEIIKTYVDPYL